MDFDGGKPYNLKDLLTEIGALEVVPRGHACTPAGPMRARRPGNAGAKRLLTPEELARKTVALTGFDWHARAAASSGNVQAMR